MQDDKQRAVGRKREEAPPENAYYERVSERYGIAQILFYIALFAFVVFSMILHTDRITYENFYYFSRDLGASAESATILQTESVSYPSDRDQGFALYRQGIAVAGNSAVTVFSASGKQLISESVSYQSPTAVGTGKYLLVYEMGGTQYSLYNSYARISSGETEAPIRGADIAPTGSYALIYHSAEYDSVVDLYDSHLRLLSRYSVNGYVADVSIHPKGGSVALIISTPAGGSFQTYLRIYDADSGKVVSETLVGDGLGLRCSFSSSSAVSVLTTAEVCFFNSRGKRLAEQRFSGESVACADLNANGAVVVLKESPASQKIHIMMFDKSGKKLYNGSDTGEAKAVSLVAGTAFVQKSESVLRVRKNKTAEMEIPTSQSKIIAVDRDNFFLCTAQQAVCYRFSA